MNANELADELENITTYKEAEHDVFSDKEKLTEAATMLRQQQAEIEALKADSARYQWLRTEFAAGRETYLAEGIPNGEELDKYIDRKSNK